LVTSVTKPCPRPLRSLAHGRRGRLRVCARVVQWPGNLCGIGVAGPAGLIRRLKLYPRRIRAAFGRAAIIFLPR
jgi:hypothetical protein